MANEGWLAVISLGVTLTLLSLLRDRVFSTIGRGLLFRLYAAPGVFVHELSHALTAILVRFTITKISFFSPQPDGTLGFVQYQYRPSLISPVLRLFVGIAPFSADMLLCAYLIGYSRRQQPLTGLHFIISPLMNRCGLVSGCISLLQSWLMPFQASLI